MSKRKPRAAIYARISDARDGDTAGVDRQLQDCLAHSERKSYAIVDQFVDNNRSAHKPNGKRPSYDRMMQAVESGDVDVIVVYDTTRLYRQPKDLEALVTRLNAASASVDALVSGHVDLSTADGRLHARVLGDMAAHESEKRGERVARAARERAERGRFGGGPRRFGYNANCTELVPDEADALRYAYETVAAGGTIRSVWREWQARGLKGPSGGSLPTGQITALLKRPMNAGLKSYKGELLPGDSTIPAIVDVDLWRKVQAILSDPSRTTTSRGRPSKALMAGFMVCGVCGAKVYRHYRGRDRTNRASYACSSNRCTTRSGELVDTFVTELIGEWLAANADKVTRPKAKPKRSKSDPSAQADQLRVKLDDLALLLAAGDLSAKDYARAVKEVRVRLDAVEQQIADEVGMTAVRELSQTDDVRQAWLDLDTERKRGVIAELLGSGVVEQITLQKLGPNVDRQPGIEVKWSKR